MSYLEKTDPLWELIERIAGEEDLLLYDVERQSSGLRVTITRPKVLSPDPDSIEVGEAVEESGDEAEGATEVRSGVSSGDCSKICRRLMVQFEAEGPEYGLSNEPHIEVSSPGIDRILRTEEQFQGAVGERVKIHFEGGAVPEALEAKAEDGKGKKKKKKSGGPLLGDLKAFTGGELLVCDEQTGEEISFPYAAVRKASVAFKF